MNELEKVNMCVIFLAKNLCIDTNATEATITQDITHEGKKVGKYKIVITKEDEKE